jgi:hypothetical protein
MTPAWLFEADVFGVTAEPIKAEIRRRGMRCEVARQDLLARGLAAERLGDGDCVIACGSFPFVYHVQTHRGWTPGAFCTARNFACSAYYPRLAAHLLNAEHEILAVAAAIDCADELLARFSRGGQVFVRPDGSEKAFTGRVVARDDFAAAIGSARYNSHMRVVVAPARLIRREWRLVIAGDRIVAGSQYFDSGRLAVAAAIPDSARRFAEDVLASVSWRPDPIFMLDLGDTDDEFCVIEIGPFSTCAFYDCDPAAVVSAASEIAAAAWPQDAN